MKQFILGLNLNLRKIILILTVFSFSILFITSLFIFNYVIKEQLIQNTLSVNLKYALKVANSADQQFSDMLKELKYSSDILGRNFSEPQLTQEEVIRIKNQSSKFNSVLIVDKQSKLIAFEPKKPHVRLDHFYKTIGINESLKRQNTYISSPYSSLINNLVVLLSQPIFDQNRNYQGMIGGTVYLQKDNLIQKILTDDYDFKKSYLYVIDQHSRIIFHPDPLRVGQKIINNNGLDYINRHQQGIIKLVNSQGIENLAGFAHIPSVNWIVVSQQPTKELLKQADALILKASIGIFIFYLIIFYLIWRMSRFISSPLNNLAHMASRLSQNGIQEKIKKIDPWYFEVFKFRTSLLVSSKTFNEKIIELNHNVITDPLTELYNRRGMNILLKELIETKKEFAILAIDIDFFKKINDTQGHDQGDAVLKTLAKLMKDNFRTEDICCRTGGEEFIVLMTTSNSNVAYNTAERLRETLEHTSISSLDTVTISIGVAFWPRDSENVKEVFKLADKKLYEAKNRGRNCVR